MVGWHHQLNGQKFEHALGGGDGQGSLACCSPCGCKESDMTERVNCPEAQSLPRGVGPLCSALSLSISSAVAHTSRLRAAVCPQAVGPAWPLFRLRPCWSHPRLNDNHSLPKAFASTAPAASSTASVLHRSINKADNLGLVKVRWDPRADPPPKRGESITG